MANRDTIERIAIAVVKRHTEYSRPLKETWTRLYTRYENQLRANSITAETESKVRLGQAYSLVENFVSRIIAQRPQFRYLARERGDVKSAELYNEYSQYQHDIAQSQVAFEEISKWGGICGLSGFLMGWRVEELVRKLRGKEIAGKKITNPLVVAMTDKLHLGKSVKIDQTETESHWTITPFKPHDLIWDVSAISPETSKIKGYRTRKTIKELKSEGYDTRRIVASVKSDDDYWREQMNKHAVNTAQNRIMEAIETEVAELYVEYFGDNGYTEHYVITLAGTCDTGTKSSSPVAIRFERNPFDKQFCPVNFFRPVRRPGKVEGFGIIEPVESILDCEEDSLNMTVEAAWTDVSRPMEYVPDNVLNEEDLQFKPRTLVPVKALGQSIAVMDTPRPDSGTASFLLGYAEKAKQNVSAVTDYQTGANQYNRSETLGEVQIKTFLSEQRLNNILGSFEQEVLEKAGKQALWLNQQYLGVDTDLIYRVLGKKGQLSEEKIKFKDIEAVKDLAIVSGTSAYVMRATEKDKWISLLQIATQEATIPNGVPIDREYIWKHLLEDGYFIEDSENVVPSLKEREQANVQKKLKDIEEAKKENLDPATARIEPGEDHKTHMQIHRAALQNQGAAGADGQKILYTPEQMEMLTQHLDEHARAMGATVPGFTQAREAAAGQQIINNMNPNEQVPGISAGQASAGRPSA